MKVIALRIAGAAMVLGLLASTLSYLLLRASLPALDGELIHPALRAPATLSRDALGTAVVHAENRADAMFALGLAHAQDRYFQMDLARRMAAGELAALFGEVALPSDRRMRPHRLRQTAREALAQVAAEDRPLLRSYVQGINSGLAGLGSRPFEYWLLGQEPQPWKEEDSILVSIAMMINMTGKVAQRDFSRELLRRLGGEALLQFLQPAGSKWDSALDGSRYPAPGVPGEETFSLEELSLPALVLHATGDEPVNGSNSWAVDGSLTAHGGAMVANDPHLGLSVPIIWYRTQMNYLSDDGEAVTLTGVSLAGLPSVAIGSNGHIAWSMTNSAGDWADLIALEIEGGHYRTSEGLEPLQRHSETIEVADGEDQVLELRYTRWGPVTTLESGEQAAYRWLAHQPRAHNALPILELERTTRAKDAVAIANRTGVSPFNYVVADAAGQIQWTVLGILPQRDQTPTERLVPWQDADTSWHQWLPPQAYPRLGGGQRGYLWTANNRVVGGQAQQQIGAGGYELGARAWLIERALGVAEQLDEQAMAAIQQNHEAVVVQEWRDHLLALLGSAAELSDAEREALALLDNWSGRAGRDDVAYTIASHYRQAFAGAINEAIDLALRARGLLPQRPPAEEPRWLLNRQSEAAMAQLRDQHPRHWLPANYDSWTAFERALLQGVLTALEDEYGAVSHARWGRVNALRMSHPLAAALPAPLARWLNMPPSEQAGDSHVPLAQHPAHGQSMRFVVAPSREDQGILTMPGGQSGHPLSPFYRAGHDDYVQARNTPLLPGPLLHTLALSPSPAR